MTRDKSAALRVVADATLFVLPSGVDLKVYRNIDCSALAAEVSVTYCRVEQPMRLGLLQSRIAFQHHTHFKRFIFVRDDSAALIKDAFQMSDFGVFGSQ